MKSLGDKPDSNGYAHILGKLLLIVLADEGKLEEQTGVFFKSYITSFSCWGILGDQAWISSRLLLRPPSQEVTTALRHLEAAGLDHRPPPVPPLRSASLDWREFPFMAPGCQCDPAHPIVLFVHVSL